MQRTSRLPLVAALVVALGAPAARAAEIAYISSSSGYPIGGSSVAVTEKWQGQPPMHGFSGYGMVQQNGRCLTGRTGNQPLTWETCRNDASQRWSLRNRRLNNEGGWCADVQGNRAGPGVPVLAWNCSGAINQQFNSHMVVAARDIAPRLPPAIQPLFVNSALTARPGQMVSTQTGRVISNDGGSLISQDGGGLVASGGGNLVASGGGN